MICCEAGTIVRIHALLYGVNINMLPSDGRHIEGLVQGLLLRYFVSADNQAHPGAADIDGVTANTACQDKEKRYPQLVNERCTLVVLALRGEMESGCDTACTRSLFGDY